MKLDRTLFSTLYIFCRTDLLLCIEDQIIQGSVNRPDVQMIILDDAAIIKPGASDSFYDYISTIMVYILSQFSGEVIQVDIVFEIYIKGSLKASI